MAYLLERRGSGFLVLRGKGLLTMAIFIPYIVKSCEGGHGISSREEGVWPSSSKRERSITMAILLLSLVKSC